MVTVSRNVLRPPHQYTREMPNVFGLTGAPSLKNWAVSNIAQRTVDCPEEYFEVVENCYVYNGAFVLHQDPYLWVEDSVKAWSFKDDLYKTLKWRISEKQQLHEHQTIDGRRNVVIAKLGYANYGHVLVEMAPKMVHIAKANLGPVNVLVPEEMWPLVEILRRLAAELAIDAEFSQFEIKRISAYREVIYFGPVSKHPMQKSKTLLAMRDIFVKAFVPLEPEMDRCLYVRRGEGDYRRTSAELDAFIESVGFEPIDPGKMTLEQQVQAFRAAKRVIGPLGAGLTNILFTQPECEVFMIDPGLLDFFFWDLCGLTGGKFNWFFSGDVQHYSEELARAIVTASISDLEGAFRRIGWL